MTTEALAKKLRDMRADENLDVDVATRLFGVIFCEEIGSRSQEFRRREYKRGSGEPDGATVRFSLIEGPDHRGWPSPAS